jgi:hypothetical protein
MLNATHVADQSNPVRPSGLVSHLSAKAAIASLFVLLAGCESMSMHTGSAGTDSASLYQRAIVDAAVASQDKVRPLLPIPVTDTVRVAAWVGASSNYCPDGKTDCQFTVGGSGIWVSLDGEVQKKCVGWGLSGDPLRERLEQLLGLPPNQPVQYQKTKFVVFEIPNGHLQRPCVGLGDDMNGQPACSIRVKSSPAISSIDFVGGQMASSYIATTSGAPGYPYTRLGYTYDWSPASTDHYGASEFILVPGTTATLKAQMNTDAYCKPM